MMEDPNRVDHAAVDDAFDLAIGRVVRAASAIEAMAADIHHGLAESPHARVLTDGLPLDHLLQGISRLSDSAAQRFDHKTPTITEQQRTEIASFVSNVRELMKDRQSVVHGSWHFDLTNFNARSTGLARRSGYVNTKWTVGALRDLHNALRTAHLAGDAIMWHLLTSHPLVEDQLKVVRGEAADDGPAATAGSL